MAGKQTTGSRVILGLVGVLGSLSVAATATRAAVYANGTDLNQAVARAQAYIACNGGPAVTVETYRSDGTLIDYFSGSLLTSPDGKNRTVISCSHGWFQALAKDPNAYARVLTGTSRNADRGLDMLVSQVLIAPGADGSLNTLDLIAMLLPADVPNTGRFTIGSAALGAQVTTTGVGFRLTQQQLQDGTFAPRDGKFARFDGDVNPGAFYGSNYYLDTAVFQVGEFPHGGVGATGDSGSGTFLDSSVQFDAFGRITAGTYLGTTVGYGGDRLSSLSGSLYVDANTPEAYAFLNSAINTPEPGSATLLLAAGLLMRRGRRASQA